MPGLVPEETYHEWDRPRHKSRHGGHHEHPSPTQHPQQGHAPSSRTAYPTGFAGPATTPPQVTSVYRTSGGDSYRVPYPFRTNTTAYGLNEPQWSVGPPPVIYDLSPYSRVPLPPMFSIHPLLAFDGREPGITWLVDKHPQQAMLTPGSAMMGGRSPADLYHWKALPATDPIIKEPLHIRLHPFTSLITVNPTNGVITVGDVLIAVYNAIRQNATQAFCTGVGLNPAFISSSEMAAYGRMVSQDANVGPPMGDDGVSSHVRHLMEFRTRWAGLTPSRQEANVWVLHTRRVGD
ncbi:hypothetical protein CVT26_007499 [Gymnopilus dilepis]|uniref:DUF6699 domain-containing protein n=1 Tax=Gymnopilus dilepis TaxID=231916 RepID=A0A409YSP2_9AGAR|nr:hypothetical protein CVT26_007499 [Gymnopilus dilepis]